MGVRLDASKCFFHPTIRPSAFSTPDYWIIKNPKSFHFRINPAHHMRGHWRCPTSLWWPTVDISTDFLLIFQTFMLIFAKIKENQHNSTEINKNYANRLMGRLYVTRETPGTARALLCCVVITPNAPHTTQSIQKTTRELAERQIARRHNSPFLTLFNLFKPFLVYFWFFLYNFVK